MTSVTVGRRSQLSPGTGGRGPQRRRPAALAIAAFFAAAACGSPAIDDAQYQRLRERTVAQQTAHVTVVVDWLSPEGNERPRLRVAADGDVDFAAPAAQLRFAFATQLHVEPGGDLLLTPDQLFGRELSEDGGPVAPWEPMPTSGGPEDPGAPPSTVGAEFVLDYILDPREGARAVDRETLQGTATTHWEVTVRAGRDLAEVPESYRERIAQILSGGGVNDQRFVIHVWIDDDGLPRRHLIESGQLTVTVDWSDFGAPIDIQLPDPM